MADWVKRIFGKICSRSSDLTQSLNNNYWSLDFNCGKIQIIIQA